MVEPGFAHILPKPANLKRGLPGRDVEVDTEVDAIGASAQNGHAREEHDDGDNTRIGNMATSNDVNHHPITLENTSLSIDGLVIQQLQEDLEAYRYDYQFCRSQLENDDDNNLTPAEQRTFQLRMLDLGHQMRMVNHRVQLMQVSMSNQHLATGLASRTGATTANAYYGAYPPGTCLQPSAYATGASLLSAAGVPSGGNTAQHQAIQHQGLAYSGNREPPQERRGPGRPAGSKNRPRPAVDLAQSPAVPATGSAKAAALASAGAKRELPMEIRVATPDGRASGSVPAEASAARSASREKPAKRARVDVQVGSPLSTSTQDDKTEAGPSTENGAKHDEIASVNMDDATEDEIEHVPVVTNSSTGAGKKSKVAASIRAAPSSTPATPASNLVRTADTSFGGTASPSVGPAGPDSAPRGSAYTRLGHWMCTLCTSQKYLKHPPPKQPSEPSNWPLRDVSKIVTHYTRMHGEHNNIERCMELGAALDANRGPFKYWVEVTKKTHFDEGGVDAAVESLLNGRLPDVLRRLSQAANAFPRQD